MWTRRRGPMGFTSGLLFLAIGVGAIVGGMYLVKVAGASKSWPSAPGVITESIVENASSRSSDEVSYIAKISYRYTVNDVEHWSSGVSFADLQSSSPGFVQKTVDRYPVGKEVVVFYNPEEPDKAVLESGVPWAIWFVPSIGVLLSCAGFSGIVKKLRFRLKR